MSGSTDGLVNIFDVNESSEDDALQHCLNTEDSVVRENPLIASHSTCKVEI
jgi:hypothetical protein